MNKTELKNIRTNSKMTQAEFAKEMGVSANTIYQWESGNGAPRGGWNNSFKKKLAKLPKFHSKPAGKESEKVPRIDTNGRPVGTNTQTEQAVDDVKLKPAKVTRLVQSLSSVLLDHARLDQTQKLLIDAHAEGLTLVRLLELLGIMIAPDGPGCASLADHPNLVAGWGCCACAKAHPEGMGTYNSSVRGTCRVCGHVRCVT